MRKNNVATTMTAMTWDQEIRALAADFMISKAAVKRIVASVQAGGYTGDQAYNKAWKKLFDLM